MQKPATHRSMFPLGFFLTVTFFGFAVEAQTDPTRALLAEIRKDQGLSTDLGSLVPEIELGEFGLIPLEEGRSQDLIPGIPSGYQLLYCPECYPGGGVIPGVPRVPPLPIPIPGLPPITPGGP